MSTDVHTEELSQLAMVASSCRQAEELYDSLRAVRLRKTRDLYARGASAIQLASILGVTRARIYAMLNAPGEDETWAEDFYVDYQEKLDAAFSSWESNDYQGDPDDYFPLRDVISA